ncbi:Predicted ATPase [Asanoa hainanensis]|uniref:Predicted ATPase n=1 Tax=Asanoa hainanensis TaxID=560556 RepID=A0A239PG86_9ACTN|nr:AAA family ATPase [Asanoa hainanensis]SNT65379.1 Predicted ATPase [Asanoa hainanensis]
MGTRVGESVIGREHPAAMLRAEVDRVTESHGGLVLVTGEAGIGKTTLVTGAVDEARARGVTVLGGRCWDSESAPGYWPWVQVLRGLRRHATPDQWAEIEEAGGAAVAVLLGKTSDPETEAFTVYDGVTAALVAASQHAPVMVVFDDLHWADPASLRLLEFAAQHTWFERLLLVGTYRDVEVESAAHPLRPLLLPLQAKATTVTLTGLEPADVGALIERAAGRAPAGDVVAEVHRRTGGNPFFVEQTARLWRADGSLTAIPPGVRDAVRRRLDLLPGSLVELLTAGSVLGHEFHRQLLAAVVAEPVPQVDRLLDQAITARLVVGRGGGRFAFSHDLVRETLYDGLTDDARRSRHASVVRAVDEAPGLRGRLFPADLARHAYAAGEVIPSEQAVDHLVAAATDASGRLAPEEAHNHYRRALERVEDPTRRVKLYLDLSMELFHGRNRHEAWAQIEAAGEVARTLDEPAVLARVALVAERHRGPHSTRTPVIEALLREAHARYVGGDGTELSRERLVGNLIARTEAEARANNNDEALAFSLWSRHDSIWGLGSARERAALMAEMETVATRSGDWQTAAFAASLRWVALLEMGDPGYYAQVQALRAMTERLDVAMARMMSTIDRSIIATLRGDFTEAAALHRDLAGFIDGDQDENAYMGQHIRWALLMLRGRFTEAAEVIGARLAAHPPYYPLVTALNAVAQGDPEPGLRHLAETDAGDRGYQRWMEPLFLRLVAELAVLTRDPDLCARARAAFQPHAGEWLVSLYGCDVSGPVELWLAQVDAAEERWAEAAEGFARAQAAADRLGARPWSVQAGLGLAEARLAQGGDAAELLSEVERRATDLDMPHVAESARALATRASSRPAPRGVASPGRAGPARDGDAAAAAWSLPWADTTVDGSAAFPTGVTSAGETGSAVAHRTGSSMRAEDVVPPAGTPTDRSPSAGDADQDGEWSVAVGAAGVDGERSGSVGGAGGNAGRSAGVAGHDGERSGPAGEAGQDGERWGSAGGAGRAGEGSRQAGGAGGGAAPGDTAGPAPAEFRRDGDVWRLAFAGQVVHLPDAKGLRDLHELLNHPGDDIAAVVLLDPTAGPELLAARRMGGDPVLDDEAKARYKRRLSELDEAIDRVAHRGDQAKLATLDAERRALIDELRAAAGLGGRTRRLGDEAERARKTVTARIRDTLRKIDERHPALAAHLREAVSTGATCRYAPNTTTTWRL